MLPPRDVDHCSGRRRRRRRRAIRQFNVQSFVETWHILYIYIYINQPKHFPLHCIYSSKNMFQQVPLYLDDMWQLVHFQVDPQKSGLNENFINRGRRRRTTRTSVQVPSIWQEKHRIPYIINTTLHLFLLDTTLKDARCVHFSGPVAQAWFEPNWLTDVYSSLPLAETCDFSSAACICKWKKTPHGSSCEQNESLNSSCSWTVTAVD